MLFVMVAWLPVLPWYVRHWRRKERERALRAMAEMPEMPSLYFPDQTDNRSK